MKAGHRASRSDGPRGKVAATPPARGGDSPVPAGVPLLLKAAAAAGVIGSLFIACLLFRYAHAVADDYSRGGRVIPLDPNLPRAVGDPNISTGNLAFAYDANLPQRRWTLEQRWASVLEAARWEHNNWSGRWSGSGGEYLAAALVDLSDPWSYRLLLIGVAAFWLICLHLFVAAVLRRTVLGCTAAAVTLSLAAVYWTGVLLPGETFCWLSAGIESNGGMALAMLALAWILWAGRRGRLAQAVSLPFLMAMAVTMTGMHELYGMVFCAIVCLGAAAAIWRKIPGRWLWGGVAAAALAGVALVVTAPGNEARKAMSPNPWDLQYAVKFTLTQLRDFIPKWASETRLWAATLLLWLSPGGRRVRPAWLSDVRLPWKLLIPVTWGAAVCLMFFAPAFAAGGSAPFRLYNVVHMVFLLGWFLTAMLFVPPADGPRPASARGRPLPAPSEGWRVWLPAAWAAGVGAIQCLLAFLACGNLPKEYGWLTALPLFAAWAGLAVFLLWNPQALQSRRLTAPALFVLLVLWPASLICTGNTPVALRDLTEKQRAPVWGDLGAPATVVEQTRLEYFDQQMSRRAEYIRLAAARGFRHVCVQPVTLSVSGNQLIPGMWPKSYFQSDLAPDPGYWVNRETCPFFRIDSLRTGPGFACR